MTQIVRQSEAQFQVAIVELARLNQWMTYHTYNSQRSSPGFPDLVLLRAPRLIVAELKTQTGRLLKAQADWIENFRLIPCEEILVRVWRPADWPEIERELAR